jgi:hypothetical protein
MLGFVSFNSLLGRSIAPSTKTDLAVAQCSLGRRYNEAPGAPGLGRISPLLGGELAIEPPWRDAGCAHVFAA